MNDRTLRQVIWGKIISLIDDIPAPVILSRLAGAARISVVVGLFALLGSLDQVLFFVATAWGGLIPRVVFAVALYKYTPRLWAWGRGILAERATEAPPSLPIADEHWLGTINAGEFLDFLSKNGHAKTSQYMTAYPDTVKHDLTALCKRLLEIGVLVKGDNNSNVLGNEYTLDHITDILHSADTPEKLLPINTSGQTPIFAIRQIR